MMAPDEIWRKSFNSDLQYTVSLGSCYRFNDLRVLMIFIYLNLFQIRSISNSLLLDNPNTCVSSKPIGEGGGRDCLWKVVC